jgi:cysteine synthase A
MIGVPDAASIAAMRFCSRISGRTVGGSTGTNLWGALRLAHEMRNASCEGSIVTLICDGGDRYAGTYYDDGWLAAHDLDIAPYLDTLERFASSGEWREPA